MSNSLDPEQSRHFVGPDLGPNCLQRLSADNKSRHKPERQTYVKHIEIKEETSKFHRKFMSPALFSFELLKMSKLTRGPLVLYHLPKY